MSRFLLNLQQTNAFGLFEVKTLKVITILRDQDDKNDCFLVIIPIQSSSLQIIPLAPHIVGMKSIHNILYAHHNSGH